MRVIAASPCRVPILATVAQYDFLLVFCRDDSVTPVVMAELTVRHYYSIVAYVSSGVTCWRYSKITRLTFYAHVCATLIIIIIIIIIIILIIYSPHNNTLPIIILYPR